MEQEPQIEALSQLSVEEGLPFTVEEFHNNVPPFSELNDEQLESVAGGRSNKTACLGLPPIYRKRL